MTDFADLALRVDSSGLKGGERDMNRFAQTGARVEQSVGRQAAAMGGHYAAFAAKAARALGALGVALLASFGSRAVVRESEQYELRMLRINAILKATGSVAGRTAEQLENQAQSLARASLESVEGVQRAQQTLLTFRNIRGEVFDEAIKSAMDLSAAIGTDLNSSILQIAKALEDPVTGMTALTRSGTVFTQVQKDMVKEMVETGRVAEAQAFILGELQAQYGGAAEAAPRLMKAQDSLAQSMENAQRAINDTFGITDKFAAVVELADKTIQGFAEHIEILRIGVLGASAVVTAYYTPAIVGATVATARWIASLITLRGVLVTTGVGALVVGAGLVLDYLFRLRTATGSWGEALRALGNVAAAVWNQIKLSGASIAPSLQGVWNAIQSAFTNMLANMGAAWASFVGGLALSARDIPFLGDEIGDKLAASAMQMERSVDGLYESSARFAESSENATFAARALAEIGAAGTSVALEELRNTMNATTDATTENEDAARDAADALNDLGNAAGGAAPKVKDLESESDKLANTLANQVVDGAMSALDAFLDFAFRGFKDFKQFAQSILKVFTDMIKQMIMTAARNKIMISMGLSGSGGGGMGGIGSSLLGGAGGLLGTFGSGLFGAAPVMGTGLLGGLGSTLSATFGAGGGIGGLFSFGANAAAAGGGIMAGIGAALPVLGIAAGIGLLIFGFLNKKEKVIGEGISGLITMEDAIFRTYQKIETSRMFGLLKSTRTESKRLSDRKAEPLTMAVTAVRDSILSSADALGISADVFDGFSFKFKKSLKEMDDAARQAAVEEQLKKMGDALARMAFNSNRQFRKLREMGEGPSDTLNRLSSSLLAVNSAWELMDFRLRSISIAGGAAASNLVNLVGGLDAFNSATDFFYQNFFTTQERVAKATEQLTEALAEFGLELPSSRRAFREMVEMSVSSQSDDLTAALLKMAPTFAFITEQVDRFNDATNSLFRTRAEQVFAQTAEGYRKPIETVLNEEERTLLRDIVTAIREGDINNARLTAQLVAIQQRQELEPTA